jgi:hypothetical protein
MPANRPLDYAVNHASYNKRQSNPYLGLNSNPVYPKSTEIVVVDQKPSHFQRTSSYMPTASESYYGAGPFPSGRNVSASNTVTKNSKYSKVNPHSYDNSATRYSPTRAAYKKTRQEIGRQNKTLAGYQSQLGGSRFATIGGMAVAGGYMSSAVGGSFLAGAGGAILGGTATVAGASVAFDAMGKAMRNNAMNPQKGIVNNPATRSALKALNFMSSKGTRRIAFAGGGMAGALGAGIVTSAFSSSRNRMGGGLNNNRGNTF